ncbi:hypothetical protein RU639_002110 [Aspergillus parasiticus]
MLSAFMLPSSSLPGYEILWDCFLLIILIRAGIIAYRLWFHPLKSVPGPKLAAATSLYLRYHEVIEHGGLTKKLPHLHKLYKSNVIRIAPNHVHINDPTVYKIIFGSKPVFRKCGDFFASSQGIHTIITTDDPLRHRVMRNTASPLFSSRQMDRSFFIGRSEIKQAADYMLHSSQCGKPLDIFSYFQAMMTNIVAKSLLCSKELVCYDAPKSGWMSVHHFLNQYRWLIADIPCLVRLGLKLLELSPSWISRVSVGFKDLYEHCRNVGNELLSSRKRQTVLHLDDDAARDLTNSDLSTLFQQAAIYLLAGTTTAVTLTVACFHILKSPNIRERLQIELDEFDRRTPGGLSGSQLDWRELTRLNYLDAVIKESLRIIPPIPGLLPRVVPLEGMRIGTHLLPAGTRISAAQFVFHHNETIFPNPSQFDPERWLKSSSDELRTMEQYFMPFSKGSRACIGWQHANIYMFTALAHLWAEFEMTAVENTPETLDWKDQKGAVPVTPPFVRLRRKDGI